MPFITAPDGTRLFYTDDGNGDGVPILCLAGLTRTHRDFDYVLPTLAGHRVIRMDYRGRGQSDWAHADSYAIPVELKDALLLLDHLGVERVAVLGTSRGGLIALTMALVAPARLAGVCFNDIGPQMTPSGLLAIKDYVGVNPPFVTHAQMAAAMTGRMRGFTNVSQQRWLEDVSRHYDETPRGLQINYDPKLADGFAKFDPATLPDLWPLFDALAGKPLAAIRGANSDLFSAETLAEMQRCRPDLIAATVPDRAHVPFLDEPEATDALRKWISLL